MTRVLAEKICMGVGKLLAVLGVLVMVGCGGGSGGSSAQNPTDPDPDPTGDEAPAGFPESLSVVSPLRAEAAVDSGGLQKIGFKTAGTLAAPPMVEEVLADPSTLATNLQVMAFFQGSTDAQQCYGPQMDYEGHPDATGGPADGQLPSGDLGIWVETMPDDDSDDIAEACAAAQLNARMSGMENRATMALAVFAAMKAEYDATGSADISAYAPADVTFSNASYSMDSDDTTSTYSIDVAYDKTGDGTDEIITLTLVHYQESDTSDANEGLMTVRVADEFNGGNCGSGLNAITRYTSVHYVQTNENLLALQGREAAFCGSSDTDIASHGAFGEAVPAVNADITGNVVDPDTTWTDNFSVFTASFDPTPDSNGEMEGQYSYVWQAGANDSHSRVLDVGLDVGEGGESYFGFGDSVQTTAAVDEFGIIRGMICNWVGPNNNHTVQDYVQRQHLALNVDAGLYVPTNVAASDITYAPTNNCMYDGTGSFAYDRDLNGALDEPATELAVGPGYETAGTGLDFDLMQVGDGRANVWDTITNDRGYSLPVYPN